MREERNLTLLTDLYELTMMQGYFNKGMANTRVTFDVFFRSNPFGGGYTIMCGNESIANYINGLRFTDSDIEYLAGLKNGKRNVFTPEFLEYLRDFKFGGSIWAVSEGSLIFPGEPVIRVAASIMEAQLIETAILNMFNHQSLIATKASRVKLAAGDDSVLEFGLRRAQGPDAGIYGARAAVIGGCSATSNVLAGEMFGIDVKGTHAHSWVMSFPDELSAFRAWGFDFPNNCVLLVDTYDVLKSGVPNAIKVFKEMKDADILPKKGEGVYGIRIDSGDLAYLSKEATKMMNEAGFTEAIVSASNDLDEHLISSLKQQGATISLWGVGTNLITAKDCPALGGVYKLSSMQINSYEPPIPKIKISENTAKMTNPGSKILYRIYDTQTMKIRGDVIALEHEKIDTFKDYVLVSPLETWKKTVVKAGTYTVKEMLQPLVVNGKTDIDPEERSVKFLQMRVQNELDTIWESTKRFENPHNVYVDLSSALRELKNEMIEAERK